MSYAEKAREIAEMLAAAYGCDVSLISLDSVEVDGDEAEVEVTVLMTPAQDEVPFEVAA